MEEAKHWTNFMIFDAVLHFSIPTTPYQRHLDSIVMSIGDQMLIFISALCGPRYIQAHGISEFVIKQPRRTYLAVKSLVLGSGRIKKRGRNMESMVSDGKN